MQKIILASNNAHKIAEIKQILTNYDIVTMAEVGYNDDICENGETFYENALIKAKAIYEYALSKNISCYVLSDDSGLCVNALGGKPGVYSARYSGEHGNNQANRDKLLAELLDKEDRTAYFECDLVLIKNDGEIISACGKTYGKILTKEDGDMGFAYDCLFYSDDLKISFGSASHEQKNSVSHRARALEQLKNKI